MAQTTSRMITTAQAILRSGMKVRGNQGLVSWTVECSFAVGVANYVWRRTVTAPGRGFMDVDRSDCNNGAQSLDDLVHAALENYDNEEEFNSLLDTLVEAGSSEEAFSTAGHLLESQDTERRVLGEAILSRVGARDCPFADRSIRILIPLLQDSDIDVAAVAANSLGSCERGRRLCPELCESSSGSVEPLLAVSGHPSPDVRQAVAYALGSIGYSALSHDVMDRLRNALLQLASDEDTDVRGEATLALAFMGSTYDTGDIHAALHKRACDEDYEVRGLALTGLAERRDPQVADLLIHELRSGGLISSNAILAAGTIADPRLLPILIELKDAGIGDIFTDMAIQDFTRGGPE